MSFSFPEKNRHLGPDWLSEKGEPGLFWFKSPTDRKRRQMKVIASNGCGWEHVSVSMQGRCPTWVEMCFIKSQFWGDNDCVIQYHPTLAEYVNMAEYCLHLWRPIGQDLPRPPSILVGPKGN